MRNLLASLLLLPAVLRSVLGATIRSTACNNSPALCDRTYDNVTYLGAHDSPFLRDSSTGYTDAGNQFYNTTVQLNAGVRLLTAQVHSVNSSWHLCHTSCSLLDAGSLTNWLVEIKNWLDKNPNEVVTVLLVNSDDASASDLAAQYSAANIESYAYTPPSKTTAPSKWPTLQTLINNGTRLLNFVANLDPSKNTVAPYLMDEFTFIFENNYDNSSPSNFSCTADRPSSVKGNTAAALERNLMPLMNHFLYTNQLLGIQIPNVNAANVTNAPSGGAGNLGDTATECANTYGQAPTYLLVDFFNVGPAIKTVDNMNGVADAVGRTNMSQMIVSSTSGTSDVSRNQWSSGALTLALLTIIFFVA